MFRVQLFAIASMLLLISGCGPSDGRELISITGKVTFEGAPVEEGTIMFYNPDTQDTDQTNLGPGGQYAMQVVPGEHRVVIEPIMVVNQPTPEVAPETVHKKVNNIPNRYRNPETTDLKASVEKAGEFSFDMKKK